MQAERHERLRLLPAGLQDLAFVCACEEDDSAAGLVEPWPADRHARALKDPDVAHLLVVDGDTAERLGFVLLCGLGSPHRALELRRLVLAKPGGGIGRRVLRLVVREAFGELGAHRLWLDVLAGNARARHLYASEGFVEEGTLREALRRPDGGYESLVLLSMLEGEARRHVEPAHRVDRPREEVSP